MVELNLNFITNYLIKFSIKDIFTTLVDAQWRWTLMVFALSFLLSWIGFATFWYLMAYAHNDLEYMERKSQPNYNETSESFTPCVTQITGFISCFLFSMETQHTIGKRFLLSFLKKIIFTFFLI